jgi:hypothetical protein
MLPFFPELQEQVQATTFFHRYTLEECADRNQPQKPWEDGRYGFTPAQFLSLNQAVPQAQAIPKAMLFPRVTHKPGTMRAVVLGPEEVATRIPEILFGASTWRNKADVFNLTGTALPTVNELLKRCMRLAMVLPCFEVQLGAEAYTSPQATNQLLQQILR